MSSWKSAYVKITREFDWLLQLLYIIADFAHRKTNKQIDTQRITNKQTKKQANIITGVAFWVKEKMSILVI